MASSGPQSAKVQVPCPDKTLFEGDQKVNGLMQQISSYTSITQSANDYEQIKNREQAAAGMGTLMGVYFPTIQNIFGVILFIRMPWIVGLAGIYGAFNLVGFCCLTTLLTAISMSAIATNGKVPAGGSYYMISRSLGPGWGGAVGIMFYLGTTVASAMYIVGAAEIMTLYLGWGRIWDLTEGSGLFSGEYNNYRIIGLLMLTIMCSIVFVGVKYVNMSAVPFLGVVIISILFMFIGFFTSAAAPNPGTVVCMMGDVLVKRPPDGLCHKFIEDMEQFDSMKFYDPAVSCTGATDNTCEPTWDTPVLNTTYKTKCTKTESSDWTCKTPTMLFQKFCPDNTGKFDFTVFDPSDETYFHCGDYQNILKMPVWSRHGVPGLGYSDENWNVDAHHYTGVKIPITIPEMLTDLANTTNNMVVCKNYTWTEFPERTEQTWQWDCNTDQWKELGENKHAIIASINQYKEMADCPEGDATKPKVKSPLPAAGDTSRDALPYVTSDSVGSNSISSMMILIGVFFPSVTGIMAGSNRSGDLANGQKSIPKGTICAILTTTAAYLACVVLSGLACDGALMRDKFGDSLSRGDGLQILMNASITWPHPYVMLIGALLSSIGAGLQSLTGAPRLLQSIAADDVIPKFGRFAKGRGKGNEPTWAVFLTYIISAIFIIIAKIETITPFITIFFLMCYLFVNVSTTLCSLIHAPSWRPSFKYYHWSLSLLGSLCCLFLIFIVDYISAILIGCIAAALYTSIEIFGGKKEWGDSIKGLYMTMAIRSLKSLNSNTSKHTKNWRPQVLLLNKLKDGSSVIKYPKLLDFCHSLKEGKGLLIIKTLIQGDYEEYADQKANVQASIDHECERKNIAAIENSIAISPDIARDIPLMVQTVGLSGLKPNCICLNFPTVKSDRTDYSFFYNVARHANVTDCALIVTKNIDNFPDTNEIATGTIDVWWIRLDGGMTLLLSHLLKRTPMWKKCKLRIFVTAEEEDNSEAMRETLDSYLQDMRIFAQVVIVEIDSGDMEPYAQNITERIAAKKRSKEHVRDVDVVMNKARKSCATPATPKVHPDADNIPKSFSGTWSNNMTGPRSTVIKKMHQATGLNKKITEMSSDASLVLLNMPPFPLEHNLEREANYMKYIESITKNLNRLVLVRTTGNEVITAFN